MNCILLGNKAYFIVIVIVIIKKRKGIFIKSTDIRKDWPYTMARNAI